MGKIIVGKARPVYHVALRDSLMQWVKCTERMPSVDDKTSVNKYDQFIGRYQDDEGNWLCELITEKDFDKFYMSGEGYEWLEGAFTKD